jgi:putative nucleotidyltransferase with HDIG domain|nr:HDOD domain-containing protein [Deltaproteobacteria bacterium]
MKTRIVKRLEKIHNLPTLPEVIYKLGEEIRDPKSDARRVAALIEDDPSMMARILKVVNSAFYSGIEPITSVQQAVSRMGFDAVKNIALSTSVFTTFSKSVEVGFDRKEFWRHCVCTGIAADIVYNRVKQKISKRYTPDLLHLVGLLHDIGKIIFEQFFHDEFRISLYESVKRKIPLFHIELECIGSDHAQVGAWLGKKWKLSEEVIEVIRWHHEPDNATEQYRDLVILCHMANYICNVEKIGNSGDETAPAFFQSIWKRMDLEAADIPLMIEKVKEEFEKSEILLTFI